MVNLGTSITSLRVYVYLVLVSVENVFVASLAVFWHFLLLCLVYIFYVSVPDLLEQFTVSS